MISRPSDCLHHKSAGSDGRRSGAATPMCCHPAEWLSDVVTVGALPLQHGPFLQAHPVAATHATRIQASEVTSVSTTEPPQILNGATLAFPAEPPQSPVRDPFERPRQLNKSEISRG